MLIVERPCSIEESVTQAAYLQRTPVPAIAAALNDGFARLSMGTIRSLRFLGDLKTIFCNIGPFREPRRFRIAEMWPLLHADTMPDETMHADIACFMASHLRGQAVEHNVTVVRSSSELVVVDGNKRTVALFELRKGGVNLIDYAVFVVDGVKLPGCS